jgi:hypothetical protein
VKYICGEFFNVVGTLLVIIINLKTHFRFCCIGVFKGNVTKSPLPKNFLAQKPMIALNFPSQCVFLSHQTKEDPLVQMNSKYN